MAKDFAISWEQRKWEMACHFHAFYTSMLQSLRTEEVRQRCNQRIQELESEYPILKAKA